MTNAGTLFLALFTCDGVSSVVEEAVRASTGSAALLPARNLIAYLTLAAAPVAALLCALSPRLSAKVYLPPVFTSVWLALGALPLAMWLDPRNLPAWVCGIQLAVAALAWLLWRAESAPSKRPAYSSARLLTFAGAALLMLPLATFGYAALGLAHWVELRTDGFIDVHAGGISIAERSYLKPPQEVHLIGMMHLGEASEYDALFGSFAGRSTLVLEEGVTDRRGILAQPLSYEAAASALGLDVQGSVSEFFDRQRQAAGAVAGSPEVWPDVRHADIDISDFSPETLAFLERAGVAWESDDVGAFFLELMREPPDAGELAKIEREMIEMRNEVLLEALGRGLEEYQRIVVPWGALHLPGIARALEESGFERGQQRTRPLVAWRTVLAALLASAASPGS